MSARLYIFPNAPSRKRLATDFTLWAAWVGFEIAPWQREVLARLDALRAAKEKDV